jgi:hypothetical protein
LNWLKEEPISHGSFMEVVGAEDVGTTARSPFIIFNGGDLTIGAFWV